MVWGRALAAYDIMVHFSYEKNFCALIKSIILCTCVARKLVFKENSRPPLKHFMDRCNGIWGEAPAANDFRAFFWKKAFGAIKSAWDVCVVR